MSVAGQNAAWRESGQTVREVVAELTVALGGVMPGVKTA